MSDEQSQQIVPLPKLITSPSDVSHLIRELTRIDESLSQDSIRNDTPDVMANEISPGLHSILRLFKLNIINAQDRKKCLDYLNAISSKAPVMHFSFSSLPTQDFNEKLVEWLRSQIHPLVLVVTGPVPGIGAGCYLRTTNRFFDLSLKTRLKQSQQKLVDQLKTLKA